MAGRRTSRILPRRWARILSLCLVWLMVSAPARLHADPAPSGAKPTSAERAEAWAVATVAEHYAADGPLKPMADDEVASAALRRFVEARRRILLARRLLFGLHPSDYRMETVTEHRFSEHGRHAFLIEASESALYLPPRRSAVKTFYYVEVRERRDGSFRLDALVAGDTMGKILRPFTEFREMEPLGQVDHRGWRHLYYGEESLRQKMQTAWRRAYKEAAGHALRGFGAGLGASLNRTTDLSLSSLDRRAMRDYQTRWALGRHGRWGDFSRMGGDCQNYASQVMLAGGLPMDRTGVAQWYFDDYDQRVPAWSGVRSVYTYLMDPEEEGPRARAMKHPNALYPGDLIQFDWDGKDLYDHTAVVYEAGRLPTVSGHTQDMLHYPLYLMGGQKRYLHLTG